MVLFRGKDSSGKWVYGSLIQAEDYCCILEEEQYAHPIDYPYLDGFMGTFYGKATPVDPETVGEFIGLVDKTDNKIFENDIVETEFGRLCVIVWFSSPTYCGWDLDSIRTSLNLAYTKPPRQINLWRSICLKVVGNTYDNPELFKEHSCHD